MQVTGMSGHNEGTPVAYCRMALLIWRCRLAPPEDNTAIEAFMTAHPPRSPALESVAPCCRIQEAFGNHFKKFYIRLAHGFENIECMIVRALVSAGGKELFGQTPRDSLERKIAELLKQSGLDKAEL